MKRFLLSSLLFCAACGGSTDDGTTTPGGSTPSNVPSSQAPTNPPTSPPSKASDPGAPSGGACSTSAPCIEADVTLTDGSTFHFLHEAIVSKSDGAVSLRAVDTKASFGISIFFKPNALKQGEAYPSELSGAVWMSVYRKHPTEEGKTRLSTAQDGSIVFVKTGATSAESALGTFDGVAVIRNEPDDTTNIRLTKGAFRAGPL